MIKKITFLLMMLPVLGFGQLATWNFFGATEVPTWSAATIDANLVQTAPLTRGSGAAESAGGNSFRTVGFMNDGIDVINDDYFQFELTALTGFEMSLSSIDGQVRGTSSFTVAPGVENQFAYSLDGTTFTLIGSPLIVTTNNSALPTTDLSGISALQNIAAGTTVTFRFYASGQTTTGGWGFTSASATTENLVVGGTSTAATSNPCTLTASAGSNSPICAGSTLNLTANTVAGATYEWTGPNSFTSSIQNPSIPSATAVASGTYTLTITEGTCVETAVVQVVVNPLPVVTISANGLALTASSLAGATYQWINCADDTPVTGATAASQTFVATANGSYKVEVTDANGCVATSSCSAISTVGVEAKTGVDSFSLSPNPTKGKITITASGNESANVVIFNALGKEITRSNNVQNGTQLDLSAVQNGVYMVQISTDKGTKVLRIVKN